MMVSLKVFFWTSVFWMFLVVMGWGFLRFFDTNRDVLGTIFPHIKSLQQSPNQIPSDTLTLSGIIASQINTLRSEIMTELAAIKNTIQTNQTTQQLSQPSPQTQPQEPTATPPVVMTGSTESTTGNQTQPTTGSAE